MSDESSSLLKSFSVNVGEHSFIILGAPGIYLGMPIGYGGGGSARTIYRI